MSTQDIPGADIKAATLKMKLHADSGYESVVEYRISANQWSQILSVAEDCNQDNLIVADPGLLAFVKEWLERQGTDDNYMTAKARAIVAKVRAQATDQTAKG